MRPDHASHGDLRARVPLRAADAVGRDLLWKQLLLHGAEAEPVEEPVLEREREDGADAELCRLLDDRLHQHATEAAAVRTLVHGERAELRQLRSVDAQAGAADDAHVLAERENDLAKCSIKL